jgi:hypothetical protein
MKIIKLKGKMSCAHLWYGIQIQKAIKNSVVAETSINHKKIYFCRPIVRDVAQPG